MFNRSLWHAVTEQREDAYSVVCDVFGLNPEIKDIIEDSTESDTIRFGNMLHCLYHKDTTITLETVITEISKKDDSLAQVITYQKQLASSNNKC